MTVFVMSGSMALLVFNVIIQLFRELIGRMVKKSAPIENRKDLKPPHGGVNLTLRTGLHVS
jgi:hypothetical protein